MLEPFLWLSVRVIKNLKQNKTFCFLFFFCDNHSAQYFSFHSIYIYIYIYVWCLCFFGLVNRKCLVPLVLDGFITQLRVQYLVLHLLSHTMLVPVHLILSASLVELGRFHILHSKNIDYSTSERVKIANYKKENYIYIWMDG